MRSPANLPLPTSLSSRKCKSHNQGGFGQKAQAVKLGEAAARKALPQIKAALAKYGRTAAE